MKNNVDKIYENREKFVVIGLTGKTGSGCSTVAKILEEGYQGYNAIDCNAKLIQNRKAEIIKKFASINFKDDDKKFKIIRPSTLMMMLFIFEKKIFINRATQLKESLDKIIYKNIESLSKDKQKEFEANIKKELIDLKKLYKIIISWRNELDIFEDLEKNFNEEKDYIKSENIKLLSDYIHDEKEKYEKKLLEQKWGDLLEEIKELFKCASEEKNLSEEMESLFNSSLKEEINNIQDFEKELESDKKADLKRKIVDDILEYIAKNKSKEFIDIYEIYNKKITEKRDQKQLSIEQLQLIGDLVREQVDIFQLPKYVNFLIKAYRKQARNNIHNNGSEKSCYIVIDSLKNPFEILYFKERYSAYYTFSIHAKDETIYKRFSEQELETIRAVHKKELNENEKGKKGGSLDSSKDFNSQNVIECIQRSDIYIDNNNDKKGTLYKQIFRYLSLIVHPGLITPSKDEMIMQFALNAKFNSGCISRQVGAVVLNKYDSVKAIGWNEVPEGQMPCLLRSHSELLNNSTLSIYSKYEKTKIRTNEKFKYIFSDKKPSQYEESDKRGLNDSFCFKSIQNDIEGDRNQVYTRSLHAEENAFLQASKYGNSEIIGGQLFTTASPCFLCAKKAYQLGMKRIIYIEAYPDISNEQVFEIGNNEIEMVHFRGAIGLAYQKLYEPIFSYKDELKALNKR